MFLGYHHIWANTPVFTVGTNDVIEEEGELGEITIGMAS